MRDPLRDPVCGSRPGTELHDHSGQSESAIIDQLDERLSRTDDNIEDLIARYAGEIDRSTSSAAAQ